MEGHTVTFWRTELLPSSPIKNTLEEMIAWGGYIRTDSVCPKKGGQGPFWDCYQVPLDYIIALC